MLSPNLTPRTLVACAAARDIFLKHFLNGGHMFETMAETKPNMERKIVSRNWNHFWQSPFGVTLTSSDLMPLFIMLPPQTGSPDFVLNHSLHTVMSYVKI